MSVEEEPNVESMDATEVTEATSPSLGVALEKIGLELPSDVVHRIQDYCYLLWNQNQTVNLTRHTNFDIFAARDVTDAVEVAKLIDAGEEILDIGSGGGVPGLLLSILRPDLRVNCVDSVGKKVAALQNFVDRLKLDVPIFHCRAEELLESFRYDCCVARAVGPLWKLCHWFGDHWINVGRLLAVKGPRYTEEIAEARSRKLLDHVNVAPGARYPIPGSEIESVILEIRPKISVKKSDEKKH